MSRQTEAILLEVRANLKSNLEVPKNDLFEGGGGRGGGDDPGPGGGRPRPLRRWSPPTGRQCGHAGNPFVPSRLQMKSFFIGQVYFMRRFG